MKKGRDLCREERGPTVQERRIRERIRKSVRREPLKLASPVPSPLYLNHIAWLIAVI